MTQRRLMPASYGAVLSAPGARPLLSAVAVSYLGDGLSAVTIAWLALQIAPAGHTGLFVGAAVAAYGLPTVIGTFALGRFLHRRSARTLVTVDSALRFLALGAIALLRGFDALHPTSYLILLAVSSLLAAWGVAGKYTLLSEVAGPANRLAVNAVISALGSAAVIAGPAVAGLLLGPVGAGVLIAADAASFAYLGLVAAHTRTSTPEAAADTAAPADPTRSASGLRIIAAHHLLGLLALSWVFFFLYGPVEVALPVHVAHDLHAGAGTLGLYWSLFGGGALIGSLGATALRNRPPWSTTLIIAAGWGACLLPFGLGPPMFVTMIGLGVGGLIYGPFTPLTYALFQAGTPVAQAGTVLASRNAIMTLSTPLGTVLGGPLTAALGAAHTLALSGAATILLVVVTATGRSVRRRGQPAART
jgi:predicted MFS family arabinose efflux permease